jgi:lysozyme family protein
MKCLTHYQAIAMLEALEVQPELQAFGEAGRKGEVHFNLPSFDVESAKTFVHFCVGEIQADEASITFTCNAAQGDSLPTTRVIIHTEN